MVVGLAALMLVLAGTAEGKGLRRGRRAGGCSSGGASCGMSVGGCGAPSVAYQAVTEWVTVTRQVCTWEPTTKDEEYTEVTFTPEEKKEQRDVEYYENVTKKKTVKQKFLKLVTEKKKEKINVAVPVTKKVEQTFVSFQPKVTTEKRTAIQLVRQTRTVTRAVPVTTYERVPVPGCRTVCVPVGGCDTGCDTGCGRGRKGGGLFRRGSGCGASRGCGQAYVNVQVPTVTWQCVPRTVMVNQTFNVCEYVPQQVSFDVQVCTHERKEEKRMVDVQAWETKEQEREIDVASWQPAEQDVEVQWCELEKKTRKVDVVVVTMKRNETKKTRKVTTYNLVTKNVTEKVPVTRYVPVQAAPCGPVYQQAPCGY
jgi:hypothetical protein